MKFEYFLAHLERTQISRRQAVQRIAGIGAAAGAAGVLASLGEPLLHPQPAAAQGGGQLPPEPLTDDIFDVAAVEAGAWVPGPYGPGDQRGSLNEVTPEKTASALRLLDANTPVVTYNLGELMFNGFPAFRTTPPRLYQQRLTQSGYQPPADFEGFRGSPAPGGPNRISGHEERFPESGTYQIATQLDNLNHVGLGEMFYNGFRGPDIARTWGTAALGMENVGPIVTRGIVLDIVGLKRAQGATGDYFTAGDGGPVLRDNYRITVEDMTDAMQRQGIGGPTPGDAVLLRTGWTHLVRTDPERYLMQEPGIYLREARYLGSRRPALIGGDAWGLEVLDPEVTQGYAFPVHQLLFMRYGVRIGEGVVTEGLVEDGVFEFVYMITPQYAQGATAGNTPPAALGQPGRRAAKEKKS